MSKLTFEELQRSIGWKHHISGIDSRMITRAHQHIERFQHVTVLAKLLNHNGWYLVWFPEGYYDYRTLRELPAGYLDLSDVPAPNVVDAAQRFLDRVNAL